MLNFLVVVCSDDFSYDVISYFLFAVCRDTISYFLVDSGTDLIWLQITAAMIGKFGITGAYSLSYLYSSEIFPTVVR